MHCLLHIIRLSSVLFIGLLGTACSKDPYRYVNNIYVGSWHIDTAKVNVSISLNGADINNYPFFSSNYGKIRELLKEPGLIKVSASGKEDPHSGTYTCYFSDGTTYEGTYKLASNILYLNIKGPSGDRFAIPCQADGNTLQIFYSNTYMTSVLWDYVQDRFPDQMTAIKQALSGTTLTIEGLGVYNTRIRGSDVQ